MTRAHIVFSLCECLQVFLWKRWSLCDELYPFRVGVWPVCPPCSSGGLYASIMPLIFKRRLCALIREHNVLWKCIDKHLFWYMRPVWLWPSKIIGVREILVPVLNGECKPSRSHFWPPQKIALHYSAVDHSRTPDQPLPHPSLATVPHLPAHSLHGLLLYVTYSMSHIQAKLLLVTYGNLSSTVWNGIVQGGNAYSVRHTDVLWLVPVAVHCQPHQVPAGVLITELWIKTVIFKCDLICNMLNARCCYM